MQKTHYLKTWPEFFQAVKEGRKTFEIRANDRDYEVNDILVLEEFDPEQNAFTGAEDICLDVIYMLGRQPFVPEGYVCMSIRNRVAP